MNYRRGNTFVNQNFAVVFLFADKVDSKFFEVARGTLCSAYPHYGCIAHPKDFPGFLSAIRHSAAQNENYVR
jgi:hypothetical protein